jgi:AcrR family transcriptional regulator
MSMDPAISVSTDKSERIPPRARILAAAGELFYREGIRAVGVEAIAEAAGTNKMTLYRHFASKDELVAEYLRERAKVANAAWDRLAAAYPGDALVQLRAWIAKMAERLANDQERGCALVNAAVELPEKSHPARRVIEEFKTAERTRLTQVCRATGLNDPDVLAEELHLMLEGARVTAQSVGRDGLSERVMRMSEALIAAHARK